MHQITKSEQNSRTINPMGELDFDKSQESEDTLIAALSHQLGLCLWFIGPFIIYLSSDKDFVRNHASESLSWQINILFYIIISVLLVPIEVGSVIILMMAIVNTSLSVVASIRAVHGYEWEYPFSFNYFG